MQDDLKFIYNSLIVIMNVLSGTGITFSKNDELNKIKLEIEKKLED